VRAAEIGLSAVDGGDLGGIEIVEGGKGDDTITMDAYRARLFGNAGNDTLTLNGGPGALFGGGGDDTVTISGAKGRLYGDFGNGRLFSADSSPDRDSCGCGTDEATADGSDLVQANCEQ